MERDQMRQMHCLRVAELMRKIVKENKDKTDINPESAYMVGLLHDVGYGLIDVKEQENHAEVGANVMFNDGYENWREIKYHGYPQDEYYSDLLLLLNYADMVIDGYGNQVTYEGRIQDIENRYGKDSYQYKETVDMVDWINYHLERINKK